MGGKVSVPRKIRIGRRKKKDDKAGTGDSDAPTAVVGEEGDAAPSGDKSANAGNGVETKDSPEIQAVDEKKDKPEVDTAAEKLPEKSNSDDPAKTKPGAVVVTEMVEVQAVQTQIDGRSVDERVAIVQTSTSDNNVPDVEPVPSTSVIEKAADVPLEQSANTVDDQSEEPAKEEETSIAPMSEVLVETTPKTAAAEKPDADKSADKTETPCAVKSDEVKPVDKLPESVELVDTPSQLVDKPSEPIDKPAEPTSKPSEPAVVVAASAAEVVATAAVVDKPTEPSTSAVEPPTSADEPPAEQKPETVQLSPKEKLEELVPFDFEKFPFDNVVFQGAIRGRTVANVGAVRVLEEAGLWRRIKRIAGTSAGAMTAALLAVGYDSRQLEKFFSSDIPDVMSDHRFGIISLIPNLIKSYGWNPGQRLYNWFGERMKERTGNRDITFQEVYTKFGHELCIITTNLNQMMVEYCHPKTTPNLSVRLAVRMSSAIPVYFKPVSYKLNGKTALFVDGGLLCNYPIHSYDGWWLSMKEEDQFLKKMQPLSSRSQLVMDDNERFGKYNPTTIGFLLYADHERDVFQTMLDERVDKDSGEPNIPDTKLSRSCKEHCKNGEEISGKHMQLATATDKFLQALQKEGLDKKEEIVKKDLEDALSKDSVSNDDLKMLFGEKISTDDIFNKLVNKKGNGFNYGCIATYLEQQGLDLQAGYMAEFKSMKVSNLKDFLNSLKETMVLNTQRLLLKTQDVERTVGINTHYIGTLDLDLEQADVDFLIEQGRRSTIAFLRQYAERHLQDYKLEPPKPFSSDELRRYIDDDLSEIIDPGDYSEKPPDK